MRPIAGPAQQGRIRRSADAARPAAVARQAIPSVLMLAGLLVAGCDRDPTINPGPRYPPQGTIVSGDLQQGPVGGELPAPIVVRVTDQDGDPIAGQTVSFVVAAGGGSVFAAAVESSATGTASNRWTLGTVAGDTQRVEARMVDPGTGQAVVLATFRAVGEPGAAASITALPPASRTGGAGQPVDSLVVRVADAHGNGVPGATVVWMATVGGGTISPASAATDAAGVARAEWTLGLQVGTQQEAEASLSPAVRAGFTAVAGVPLGAALVKVSGDAQAGTVASALAAPVVVELRTAIGLPLSGAAVTWTPAAGSGAVSAPVSITALDGRASTAWTLGTAAGPQQLIASVPGVEPVTFGAGGEAGSAATLTALPPTARTGSAGQPLPDALEARVQDPHGNPVPGATVAWSVSAGGGTVSPATAVTDAAGVARARWTLGAQIGGEHAAQAALSPGTFVRFTATAGMPAGAVLVKVSGDGQTGTVGAPLGQAALVELRTALGQPIAGASITWTPALGSGTATPPAEVTGPAGRASTTWTLGTFAGAQEMAASAHGAAPVRFGATAKAGAPATLTIAGGNGQTGEVAKPLAQPLAVRVLDEHGNSAAGVQVAWAIAAGSGSLSPTTSPTDASGEARTQWTLGQLAGTNAATATVAGLPQVGFSAAGRAGPTTRVVVTPDSVHLETPDRQVQLGASTVDAYGNPTSQPVTWTSLHPDVATVGATGIVRSEAPGTARVVAQHGAAADTAKVTVGTSPTAPTYVAVSAGGSHACGLADDGTAYCWGANPAKQLGVESVSGSCGVAGESWPCTGRPQRVSAPVAFRQVIAGFGTSCGLAQDGRVYCWGSGWGATPVPLQGLPPLTVVQMQKSSDRPCGLTAQGTVYCWTGAGSAPVAVPGLVFTFLGEGGCGVTGDGTAYCWTDPSSPQPVPGSLKFKQIARANVTCGLTLASETVCWEGPYSWTAPTVLLRDTVLVRVDAGDQHACGLTAGGAAYCWGTFEMEQSPDPVDPPARIGTLAFTSLSSGRMGRMGLNWWMAFDCAVSGGDIYCRGAGRSRQTGRTESLDWGGSREWRRISDP
ncbi:MAG: Ig-like domain-containing protein [Gemmatimonadetes bacterium]|nr:Ig-like domain-containing protein [Gemmatimonadota bacterium]